MPESKRSGHDGFRYLYAGANPAGNLDDGHRAICDCPDDGAIWAGISSPGGRLLSPDVVRWFARCWWSLVGLNLVAYMSILFFGRIL